jgi:hypothetical protein
MAGPEGTIALIGSGELTATMVEVHKELLGGLPQPPRAVFLDTPAGFQLNVDQISERAAAYFRDHVQLPLVVASFKSSELTPPPEAEKTHRLLGEAHYILLGPGSPTYAVRQLQRSPIPALLNLHLRQGGCLVTASAAALTVGRFTLPVYELYKVGADLHWVEGLDLLGRFDLNLVVIPHWNNAEGGTHDTRFCYMGERRFERLATLLPEDTLILGLDEHTACIIDLAREQASVRGIGQVTIRTRKTELVFAKGAVFPLDVLRGRSGYSGRESANVPADSPESAGALQESPFWERVQSLERQFRTGLEGRDTVAVVNALLDLDRTIWEALRENESPELISQAREVLRELIVFSGILVAPAAAGHRPDPGPIIDDLLRWREELREQQRWELADRIRDILDHCGVLVEDAREGTRWHFKG